MFFRPLNDHIAVRPIDVSARTAGGIFIPDAAKTKPDQGEVIAIGPGRRNKRGKRQPCTLKPGQRVLFGATLATEIKINDEKLLIMTENNVLAVVEHSNFANQGTVLLATSALLAVVIGIVAARVIGII
jgi:chaperonin GroES